jgi:ribosomal-protein-alanine N-acetyltransferase
VIRTPRLEIRLPELADVDGVIRYYADNREHLEPWSPSWPPGFLSARYWEEQVARRRDEVEAGTGLRLFVFPSGEGRVIGNLSLTHILRGPRQSCSLGYGLDAREQGRGLMGEAVEAAVRYAFGELGLKRVEASYMPSNWRSAAVLRRAGFAVEGLAPAFLLIAGRWEDHVLTARVNPDWRGLRD